MMSRWILGMAVAMGLGLIAQSAEAQVVYAYGAPSTVYVPGAVYASPVVTTSYYVPAAAYVAPAYVASPVVVNAPVVQYGGPVVAAPVVVAPDTLARTVVRGGPLNYTQVTRSWGPTGPHYNRVHVHHGLFGTTVRERSW